MRLAYLALLGILAVAALTVNACADVPQPTVQQLVYPDAQVSYQVDLSGPEAVRHVTENLDQRGGAAALAAGLPVLQPGVTALKEGISTLSHVIVLGMSIGSAPAGDCLAHYVGLFEGSGWSKVLLASVGDSSALVMLAPEGKGLLLLFCDASGGIVLEMATGSRPFGDVISEVAQASQGVLAFFLQEATAESEEAPAQ